MTGKARVTRKTGAAAAKTATTRAAKGAAKSAPKTVDEPKGSVTLAEVESSQAADLEKGKAVAEANKEQLDTTVTPDDGRDVEELRKERAEVIEKIAEHEEAKDAALVKEAKAAGLHEAKLDDAGAAEQQKAARDSGRALYDRLGILTGPPVVAPVLESSEGSIEIVSRLSDREEAVTSVRFVGHNLHIKGEGFLSPGEVIIDTRRGPGGGDHQRFSTWTEDGTVDVVLPGVVGPGNYLVHCEQLVTQVGEGRNDGLPLVKETNELQLELY